MASIAKTPRSRAAAASVAGLRRAHRERLLDQDWLTCRNREQSALKVVCLAGCDVDRVHIRVGYKVLVTHVNARDTESPGEFSTALKGPGSHRDHTL